MKLFSILLSFTLLMASVSCTHEGDRQSGADPVKASGNAIHVQSDSKFAQEIQVVQVKPAPGGERKLKTVGQMIAIANSSGELSNDGVSWVTLDSMMIQKVGLHLSPSAPVGLAYGLTSITSNYHSGVQPGERVEIYRYGLRQNSIAGVIVSVQHLSELDTEDSVVFSIQHGADWYPGTNCQVEFPLVHQEAVALSPLSMLHEGLREFVLKETGPGEYTPVEITVVNETRDQVYAIGDLTARDRVIERGAILLKPLIHQFVGDVKEVHRVR